jgi:hypothetical protein
MTVAWRSALMGCRLDGWRLPLLIMLGLMMVSHGCHADRDTELFARPTVSAGR